MNKTLLFLTCLATLGLNAAQFSHKVTFAPQTVEGKTVYVANVQIDKTADEASEAVTVGAPELVCTVGELAEVVTGNETDFYAVKVLIENTDGALKAKTAILVKESDVDVFSAEEETVLN